MPPRRLASVDAVQEYSIRERYSRFIKSLMQVGDKRDATYKKRLGLKLEITPLENP